MNFIPGFTVIPKDAQGFSSNTYRLTLPQLMVVDGGHIAVHHIDVWYDVHTKDWVVQFKSVEGYQQGDSHRMCGRKDVMQFAQDCVTNGVYLKPAKPRCPSMECNCYSCTETRKGW